MLAYSIHSTTQKTREHVISISYNDDSRIITLPSSYNEAKAKASSMFALPLRSFKFQLDTLNICQGKMHTIEDAEVWHAIGDTISHLRVIDCLDASQSSEDGERTRTVQGAGGSFNLGEALERRNPGSFSNGRAHGAPPDSPRPSTSDLYSTADPLEQGHEVQGIMKGKMKAVQEQTAPSAFVPSGSGSSSNLANRLDAGLQSPRSVADTEDYLDDEEAWREVHFHDSGDSTSDHTYPPNVGTSSTSETTVNAGPSALTTQRSFTAVAPNSVGISAASASTQYHTPRTGPSPAPSSTTLAERDARAHSATPQSSAPPHTPSPEDRVTIQVKRHVTDSEPLFVKTKLKSKIGKVLKSACQHWLIDDYGLVLKMVTGDGNADDGSSRGGSVYGRPDPFETVATFALLLKTCRMNDTLGDVEAVDGSTFVLVAGSRESSFRGVPN
ncbi:hypothetical protein SISNIDRAFT_491417 [Sistotremastrum niveocremeum HHB9708]|uniref:Uncharacterized protein n=1 Tax=Sistotremastrum niveocremeum HHB9708 TaxID=1314777 RepID=A0A164MTE0_9AGAM|nr:hypothetical protein SISNIDRAFT_491417 [Sistotremastrum niveocremeum HHB9708]